MECEGRGREEGREREEEERGKFGDQVSGAVKECGGVLV